MYGRAPLSRQRVCGRVLCISLSLRVSPGVTVVKTWEPEGATQTDVGWVFETVMCLSALTPALMTALAPAHTLARTPAHTLAPGRSTGSGACGFGAKSRAGLGGRYASAILRAPLAPKPVPLTQSPCLEVVGAERFNTKTGCSPYGISANSYQNWYFQLYRQLEQSLNRIIGQVDQVTLRQTSPAVLGLLLPTQHR